MFHMVNEDSIMFLYSGKFGMKIICIKFVCSFNVQY